VTALNWAQFVRTSWTHDPTTRRAQVSLPKLRDPALSLTLYQELHRLAAAKWPFVAAPGACANEMTPELWKRLKSLFYAALEWNAEERSAFVSVACGEAL